MSHLCAHVIAIAPSATPSIDEVIFRYAVLAETADAALAIVQDELRFGHTARVTGEILPEEVVLSLALAPERPRLLH